MIRSRWPVRRGIPGAAVTCSSGVARMVARRAPGRAARVATAIVLVSHAAAIRRVDHGRRSSGGVAVRRQAIRSRCSACSGVSARSANSRSALSSVSAPDESSRRISHLRFKRRVRALAAAAIIAMPMMATTPAVATPPKRKASVAPTITTGSPIRALFARLRRRAGRIRSPAWTAAVTAPPAAAPLPASARSARRRR